MSENTNKKNSGRPHGSITCRRVKLKDLQRYVTEEASIPISQRWLDSMGIDYKKNEQIFIEKVF